MASWGRLERLPASLLAIPLPIHAQKAVPGPLGMAARQSLSHPCILILTEMSIPRPPDRQIPSNDCKGIIDDSHPWSQRFLFLLPTLVIINLCKKRIDSSKQDLVPPFALEILTRNTAVST
jgi:hypothetical protein